MLKFPAFAKINWTLRVLGKRPDGFHEICTVFQTVSLADRLTFESASELVLTCDSPGMPIDESNLVLRAANALREKFSIAKGARIRLEKRIPSPGGLGGGSSDAAVALIALAHLWEIKTNKNELSEIGAKLGADVPFFLTGGTALGMGLGTEIELLPDVPKTLLLIITPDENVPTGEAYQALGAPLLTNEMSKTILEICRFEAKNADFLQTGLHNDFEKTIFRLRPEIARVKSRLLQTGAGGALLSGSGASVFAIFDNNELRQQAAALFGRNEPTWRVFECETISRAEYAKQLEPGWNLLKDLG
ncbi:MAG TPA: 4-(cytidine 5'-diphospho)-2-C-methyl-D-erythritol kinase [Pyrinomonadaceae bacterium]|jgi:4-diphosphocytidyl-2-C-methyl-D-erythritol kinase